MSDEITATVLDSLNSLAIPHMLVGALASNVHGIQRATKDADIVLQLGDLAIREVVQQLGPEFRFDPQMSFESVTSTRRWQLFHKEGNFMIELFLLSDDPHDQERFRRRRQVIFLGRKTAVLTAEDVIVTKLRWFLSLRRNKDWDDVRDVIVVQRDVLDWDYIHRWCDVHGTRPLLEEIRQALPKPNDRKP